MRNIHAPYITGDTWIHSRALLPNDLKGKVVLVDFWTYSCVNCQKTLPYLKKWWEKYKDKNFLIIGIHTPEFEFEKDKSNVERAAHELGVFWPIVLDNDYVNWNNFANKYWPAKYLVDENGYIVYTHFGEGEYEKTEKAIQSLLKNIKKEHLRKTEKEKHTHHGVCFRPTPEL